jgi:ArsR family transcriptional regulator, arsenate/arsenite/antimonite-responsive transcriptional repressor
MNNDAKTTDIFAALADPTRLRLLRLLSEQNADNAICVSALAMQLGVSQPAVSQHLGVLKTAGLVEGEKRSNYMHYFIKPGTLERCQQAVEEALCADKHSMHVPCQDTSCPARPN